MADKWDIVGFADLHMDNSKGSGTFDDNGVNSFLYIQNKLFKKMIDDADRYSAILVSAGDLIDKPDLDPITMMFVNDAFQYAVNKGVTFLTLTGNHERTINGDLIQAYNGIKLPNVYFVSRISVVKIKDINFYCVPFTNITMDQLYKHVKNFIEIAKSDKNKKKVLLLHYPIIGCRYDNSCENNNAGFNLKSLLDKHGNPFTKIYAGDFHKRQRLKGVDNFLYFGQPYQGDFNSADEQRGYTLANLTSGEEHRVEFKGAPKFKIIEDKDKPSEITEDLSNCIVRVLIAPEDSNSAFRDRCYELGALNVFTQRKRITSKIDNEMVDLINRNKKDHTQLLSDYITAYPKKMKNRQKYIDIGIGIINEVKPEHNDEL